MQLTLLCIILQFFKWLGLSRGVHIWSNQIRHYVRQMMKTLMLVAKRPPATTSPVNKRPRCAQTLTSQEYQILFVLTHGQRGRQITVQMDLSPKTVRTQTRHQGQAGVHP